MSSWENGSKQNVIIIMMVDNRVFSGFGPVIAAGTETRSTK